jgi:hypothetical protein
MLGALSLYIIIGIYFVFLGYWSDPPTLNKGDEWFHIPIILIIIVIWPFLAFVLAEYFKYPGSK